MTNKPLGQTAAKQWHYVTTSPRRRRRLEEALAHPTHTNIQTRKYSELHTVHILARLRPWILAEAA